jgi:hypothetical protein
LQLGLVRKDGEDENSWIGADASGHDVCLPHRHPNVDNTANSL